MTMDPHLTEFFAKLKKTKCERAAAAGEALPALGRLMAVCAVKSGQSFYVRALLYSLWNGKATPLIDLLHLDWQVRRDLLAVLAGFGADGFFYNEIKQAFLEAGLFEWFIEEGGTR